MNETFYFETRYRKDGGEWSPWVENRPAPVPADLDTAVKVAEMIRNVEYQYRIVRRYTCITPLA